MLKHWLAVLALGFIGLMCMVSCAAILIDGEVMIRERRHGPRTLQVSGNDAYLYALIPGLLGISFSVGAYLYWRENIDMSR